MQRRSTFAACLLACFLAACGSVPTTPESVPTASVRPHASVLGQEITLYALGLIDTGYRFGGKNPEAGLDCSGMVTYIFDRAAGLKLGGSAADIARRGRPVDRDDLRPGDLVFFNTLERRHSHMGIYIGDGRFVHAPNSRGRVRVERLANRYFAQRIDGARTLLASN